MLKFGFSAYLKLISLNAKPQRTVIRTRLAPGGTDPYDFHRSLRLHANRLLVKGESLVTVLASVDRLKNPAERSSVLQGLRTLLEWRRTHPAHLFDVRGYTYTSPNGVFKVTFTANFGTTIDAQRCSVHLWNTKTPPLSERLTRATLSMIKESYDDLDALVVLSLLNSREVWSANDARVAAVGRDVAAKLEKTILDVEEELHAPTVRKRPPPSPPQPPA